MKSLWSSEEAAAYAGPLGERVYTSRLLGADTTLVMHGGGNTSVKLLDHDVSGRPVDVLYVKGSGSDLASMTETGFAPVRLDRLVELAALEKLSDADMADQLRLACLRDAPAPSVEAILHAILPAKYVDHTHADAVLAITNTPSGRERIRECYGDSVVVVDYVMPGFELARRCAQEFPARRTDRTVGMVLLNHGIFSFGETARESYERMIELVTRAENYLRAHGAWDLVAPDRAPPCGADRETLAVLRRELSDVADAPMIVMAEESPRVSAFLARHDLAAVVTRGPMTPDHVIRTKRIPLVGSDVRGYAEGYEAYFDRNVGRSAVPLTMLDPAPRVVFDVEIGMLSAGRTPRDASIARDIMLHTLDAIDRAEVLEAWQALPESALFDVEYWELEQAKLRRQGELPPFAGEVALITGAASGIGRATVAAFRRAGAAVVGLDRDPRVKAVDEDGAFLGLTCDVTSDDEIEAALDTAVHRFGGIDVVVCNAGVFPPSMRIDELPTDAWRQVMAVNVDGNLALLRSAASLLQLAPRGGRVVVNASKNVAAPGRGAAAYSASKAALTQLARVAALEWAERGIRVNMVHPNAVFDTGIWDPDMLAGRAASYGLTVEEYKTNNLLGVEVTSEDVAAVIVALCTPTFAKTTGAQIPVDGGNERVV
jgi:rhamnose utilization protein RhaD (predicted bifunctional aldolase and dehydrogenase)/NAD(P)-dependent dehydrogenase (short-subunit alcohol dehydrogenase family)